MLRELHHLLHEVEAAKVICEYALLCGIAVLGVLGVIGIALAGDEIMPDDREEVQ